MPVIVALAPLGRRSYRPGKTGNHHEDSVRKGIRKRRRLVR